MYVLVRTTAEPGLGVYTIFYQVVDQGGRAFYYQRKLCALTYVPRIFIVIFCFCFVLLHLHHLMVVLIAGVRRKTTHCCTNLQLVD